MSGTQRHILEFLHVFAFFVNCNIYISHFLGYRDYCKNKITNSYRQSCFIR